MRFGVYSVYDSKAKAFLPPFVMVNDHVAVRVFADCANESGHQFCKFGSDFSLFKIAEFDDAIGEMLPLKVHENLGLAAAFQGQRVIEEEVTK